MCTPEKVDFPLQNPGFCGSPWKWRQDALTHYFDVWMTLFWSRRQVTQKTPTSSDVSWRHYGHIRQNDRKRVSGLASYKAALCTLKQGRRVRHTCLELASACLRSAHHDRLVRSDLIMTYLDMSNMPQATQAPCKEHSHLAHDIVKGMMNLALRDIWSFLEF